jgi:hypothetical protein
MEKSVDFKAELKVNPWEWGMWRKENRKTTLGAAECHVERSAQ